jgi:hypothetical protein
LKKIIATVLLSTYLVISFGYGLSSLGHMWLHAVKSKQHLHHHVDSNTHQHNIEDHNLALKVINTESQEVTNQETIALLFTFVFHKTERHKNVDFKLTIKKLHLHYLPEFYEGRNGEPNTPPPVASLLF